MRQGISFFIISLMFVYGATAATSTSKRFKTITSHDDVYPYVLNNAKKPETPTTRTTAAKATTARAATTTSIASTPAPATAPKANTVRNVVSRKTNVARSATNTSSATMAPAAARAVTSTQESRNVVSRPGNVRRTNTARNAANLARATTVANNTYAYNNVSSERCMADYKECMEMYCQREDTAYNRCYCSAKLAQIDSKYQNKIDSLIQQIIKLQYSDSVSDAEIKEYWDNTIGIYTGTNPWVNIDNALNIEWADNESRVRGQNAFNTGHQYCVQHLNACYYMATNLRDAYKSEIARDCAAYEKSLQKIQAAAESVIESYSE